MVIFVRSRPALLRAVCVALLLPLLGGCATRAMKGTPFYSGEQTESLGSPEDRVNLWPLLYYREPALSVVWPIGEYSDRNFALRPLISMYREQPGAPYTETNILWPFIQFDTARHEHRIFPVFWNSSSFIVFPLYWHFDEPFAGPSGTDALFPLWIYSRRSGERDLHLLWPFARFHDSPHEAGWRVWPLAGHRYHKERLERHTFWLWPLGGAEEAAESSKEWFLPFYGLSTTPGASSFASLAWYDRRDTDHRTRAVPLALSWRTDRTDGASALTLLLGLYRDTTAADGTRRGHLLPLYGYGPDYAISPFYARATSDDGSLRAIPPLLSWWTRDAATGRESVYAAGALYHRRRGAEGQNRDWLLPFFYRDEAEGTLMTPLWARQRHDDGTSAWSALPPLLSWHSRDSATGRDSLYAGGGLYHRGRGIAGQDRDWLLPLFYRDEADGLLLSPLYARRQRADGTLAWAVVPPALALHRSGQDGAHDTFALGGLARWGQDAAGRGRGHVLPLYLYGPKRFLSLAYADWTDSEGQRTRAVPLLLSWQSLDPATGRGELLALLGLFRERIGVPPTEAAGHLLPFYVYDRAADSFLTPLFGHLRAGGTRYAYHATPLIGTFGGASEGFWVFPLLARSQRAEERSTYVLWGRHTSRTNGTSATSFFPFYDRQNDGDPAPLLAAMEAAVPPDPLVGALGSESHWLLGLGGAKRRAESSRCAVSAWPDAPPMATNSVLCTETQANRLFPLWSYESKREVVFEGDRRTDDRRMATGSVLFWLYDYRREESSAAKHDYLRRRVLWRLWHYERLNGDSTMDLFPTITWDRRADGARKATFLWRFFRYERDAEGCRTLDLLFIPILRPKVLDSAPNASETSIK